MKWIIFFTLAFFISLHAHEGHHHPDEIATMTFMEWLGQFHHLFNHFPIVLILMAALTAIIHTISGDQRYNFITTFLLTAAVIFTLLTVVTGCCYENRESYSNIEAAKIGYHKIGGILTFILTIFTLYLHLNHKHNILYFICFLLLVSALITTTWIGGSLTFGHLKLLP